MTTNRATILEQAFNMEVPLQLPPATSSKPGADKTKYYRFHDNYGHTTEDCRALKDRIEELIQAGYVARFVRRPQEEQQANRPRQGDRFQDRKRRRNRQENHKNQEEQPAEPVIPAKAVALDHDHEPPIRGVINTIAEGFSYCRNMSHACKRHLHAVKDVDINSVESMISRRHIPPITFTDQDF